MVGLPSVEQMAASELGRGREERAPEAVLTGLQLCDRRVQDVQVVDVDGAGGGEVALLRGIGALLVLDARYQLGDQKVVVRVPLAMGVRRHVHRRARHPGGQVGAVIDVEAPYVVLVRLAFPAVLADHDARHGLEDLSRTEDRALLDLLGADDAHRTRVRQAQQAVHRLVQVGQLPEGSGPGDEHVGVQRHAERCIDAGRSARGNLDGAHRRREARQAEVHLVRAGGEIAQCEAAVGVGRCGPVDGTRGGMNVHRDSRKRTPGLVLGAACEPSQGLALRHRGRGEKDAE